MNYFRDSKYYFSLNFLSIYKILNNILLVYSGILIHN